MKKTWMKLTALQLAFVFTFGTAVNAAPFVPAPQEMTLSSFLNTVEIPESFGRITQREIAPEGPVLVHIQDAHGNLEAQSHIRDILNLLKTKYDFDLILVEGASEKLDPSLLVYFDDPAMNKKNAEDLMKSGLIKGSELYLLEETLKGRSDSVAFGAEDEKLYRENIRAYRSLLAQENGAENSLDHIKLVLLREASKSFSKDLKNFFREWLIYQDTTQDLFRHLNALAGYATQKLNIRFEDSMEQIEWPQMVRLAKLKAMESKINNEAAQQELEKVIAWARAKKFESRYIAALESIAKDFKAPEWENDPRLFLEDFYQTAAPQGFRFEKFPNFSQLSARIILASELNATELISESEKLTGLLLEKLTQTATEKEILGRFKDYILLKKLFTLSMTRDEYAQALERGENLKPSVSMKKSGKEAIELDRLFSGAMEFYRGAGLRDQSLFTNTVEKMKALKKSRAVLITGGFHSEGLMEASRENHISYAEVLPRISEAGESEAYHNVMSLKTDVPLLKSTVSTEALTPDFKGFPGDVADYATIVIAGTALGNGAHPETLNRSRGWKGLGISISSGRLLRAGNPVIYQGKNVAVKNNRLALGRAEARQELRRLPGSASTGADRAEARAKQRESARPGVEELETRELMASNPFATSGLYNLPLTSSASGEIFSASVGREQTAGVLPTITVGHAYKDGDTRLNELFVIKSDGSLSYTLSPLGGDIPIQQSSESLTAMGPREQALASLLSRVDTSALPQASKDFLAGFTAYLSDPVSLSDLPAPAPTPASAPGGESTPAPKFILISPQYASDGTLRALTVTQRETSGGYDTLRYEINLGTGRVARSLSDPVTGQTTKYDEESLGNPFQKTYPVIQEIISYLSTLSAPNAQTAAAVSQTKSYLETEYGKAIAALNYKYSVPAPDEIGITGTITIMGTAKDNVITFEIKNSAGTSTRYILDEDNSTLTYEERDKDQNRVRESTEKLDGPLKDRADFFPAATQLNYLLAKTPVNTLSPEGKKISEVLDYFKQQQIKAGIVALSSEPLTPHTQNRSFEKVSFQKDQGIVIMVETYIATDDGFEVSRQTASLTDTGIEETQVHFYGAGDTYHAIVGKNDVLLFQLKLATLFSAQIPSQNAQQGLPKPEIAVLGEVSERVDQEKAGFPGNDSFLKTPQNLNDVSAYAGTLKNGEYRIVQLKPGQEINYVFHSTGDIDALSVDITVLDIFSGKKTQTSYSQAKSPFALSNIVSGLSNVDDPATFFRTLGTQLSEKASGFSVNSLAGTSTGLISPSAGVFSIGLGDIVSVFKDRIFTLDASEGPGVITKQTVKEQGILAPYLVTGEEKLDYGTPAFIAELRNMLNLSLQALFDNSRNPYRSINTPGSFNPKIKKFYDNLLAYAQKNFPEEFGQTTLITEGNAKVEAPAVVADDFEKARKEQAAALQRAIEENAKYLTPITDLNAINANRQIFGLPLLTELPEISEGNIRRGPSSAEIAGPSPAPSTKISPAQELDSSAGLSNPLTPEITPAPISNAGSVAATPKREVPSATSTSSPATQTVGQQSHLESADTARVLGGGVQFNGALTDINRPVLINAPSSPNTSDRSSENASLGKSAQTGTTQIVSPRSDSGVAKGTPTTLPEQNVRREGQGLRTENKTDAKREAPKPAQPSIAAREGRLRNAFQNLRAAFQQARQSFRQNISNPVRNFVARRFTQPVQNGIIQPLINLGRSIRDSRAGQFVSRQVRRIKSALRKLFDDEETSSAAGDTFATVKFLPKMEIKYGKTLEGTDKAEPASPSSPLGQILASAIDNPESGKLLPAQNDLFVSGDIPSFSIDTGTITGIIIGRSEARRISQPLKNYFQNRAIGIDTVVRVSKFAAAETISGQYRDDEAVFEALVRIVSTRIRKSGADFDLEEFRSQLRESATFIAQISAEKNWRPEAAGVAVLTTEGAAQSRSQVLLASIPLFLSLIPQERGQNAASLILGGPNTTTIKQSLLGNPELSADERSALSRILKFDTESRSLEELIEHQIKIETLSGRRRAVVSSMTQGERDASAVQNILSLIEDPSDFQIKNQADIARYAEAYVVRTLLLKDLGARLKSEARLLKKQPGVKLDLVRYIKEYLAKNLPDVAVSVNGDGSFRLSLSDVSRQLSIFKQARAMRERSA